MNSGAARVQLSGTLVILVSADGEGACDVQVHQDAGTNAALSGQAGADVLAIAQLAGGAVCTGNVQQCIIYHRDVPLSSWIENY